MDYCQYVNVFHGCGEITPEPEGIAKKWYFIKAGTGNTSPAAMRPFGAMSVAPYSGGYPTGYGDHCPNSFARPAHFEEGKGLIGFAHLQQSGTGAIGYYYNYAVVTPRYESSPFRRIPTEEQAQPGYYACRLEDIFCELTADSRTALHRYTFGHDGGTLQIDFHNNGLNINGEHRGKVNDLRVTLTSAHTAVADAAIEGVRVYFAVKCSEPLSDAGEGKLLASLSGRSVGLSVSISVRCADNAVKNVEKAASFDETKKAAYEVWNKELSRIRINADERTKRIFYSNLYHSFVKPADWSGESFIYPGDGPFLTDFATLWDMYKTAFPLLLLVNREIGEKTVETLLKTGEALGRLPNCTGICDMYKQPSDQAKMLSDYILLTAYHYGVPVDVRRMLKVIRDDVFSPEKRDFTVDHRCQSHSWFLDMTEGCALAAKLAREKGVTAIAEELEPLAALWPTVYDGETGLLKTDCSYYEGTVWNYSFRQMADMEGRMALAGGKERFVSLLDRFFGYGQPDVTLPTDPRDGETVKEGMKLGRFEGFNNESDTEAPFSYIYAGRHDRTCEIVRAGMRQLFTEGRGGIPGNNDSGALSSYYVFAALGLFPVAGQNLFLIGSPFVDEAELSLAGGGTLHLWVNGNAPDHIYVKSVTFNGRPAGDFRIPADELAKGGELIFDMTDRR
jgi:putative alpha-1,2-mannosidase